MIVESGYHHTWMLVLSFIHKLETSDGRGSRNRETSLGGIHHAPVPYLYNLLLADTWHAQVEALRNDLYHRCFQIDIAHHDRQPYLISGMLTTLVSSSDQRLMTTPLPLNHIDPV